MEVSKTMMNNTINLDKTINSPISRGGRNNNADGNETPLPNLMMNNKARAHSSVANNPGS